MTTLNGSFWRLVFQDRVQEVLEGVVSPEGRLHHSGQRAIYLSPSPEWAAIAIDAYVAKNDPPRVLVKLDVSAPRIVDLRDPEICSELNITTKTAGVPWQPERRDGRPATSWQASDAVRATDADGLIYPARSDPNRWHLVLYRWNAPGGAIVKQIGSPNAWLNPR